MKPITLSAVPVSAKARKALNQTAGVNGCVVRIEAGASRVTVYGPACELQTLDEAQAAHPTAFAYWARAVAPVAASRTAAALAMLEEDPGASVYSIAKAMGIDPSGLYREQRRRAARGCCSQCGRLLPANPS